MNGRQVLPESEFHLNGPHASAGYESRWFSFSGRDAETGEERSFFIEFFMCNPALGSEKPVFGQPACTPRRRSKEPVPLKQPSYLMVNAGSWGKGAAQLHKFFAWDKVEMNETAPFQLSAGDCFLSDDATCGCVKVSPDEASSRKEMMSGGGEMAWRLVMEKKVGSRFSGGSWEADGMKTFFKGQVRWNGRLFNVSPRNCYGYSDKKWGQDFVAPWLWIKGSDIKSKKEGKYLKNSAFAIGCDGTQALVSSGRNEGIRAAFSHEGKWYDASAVRLRALARTEFECSESKSAVNWHFEQGSLFTRIVADISCTKRDMVIMNYESPDGARRHRRLWIGGTGTGKIRLYRLGRLVDEFSVKHVGCEYGETGRPSPAEERAAVARQARAKRPSRQGPKNGAEAQTLVQETNKSEK